tara:strand:- start:48 stop:272 length:225 start_codon:yes stop_codon:yes gene_type:complete
VNNKANTVALAVSKCTLYLACAICLTAWLFVSKINQQIVEDCKDACTSSNTAMKSATAKECVCIPTQTNSWSLR